MSANPMLHFTGKKTATLFVWMPQTGGSIKIEPDSETLVTLIARKPDGEEVNVQWGEFFRLEVPGIWEINLETPGDSVDAVTFAVRAVDDAYPFVVPGPGIVPSHFPDPEPTLLFAGEGEMKVWVDVPEDLPLLTIGAWMPEQRKCSAQLPDESLIQLSWNSDPRCFYRIAEVETCGHSGWWQLRAAAPSHPFRWLKEVEAQSVPEHPTTLMLNHPSHITGAEERHAYFRSWWVADKYDQVLLVENYDFPSWFERLNLRRRLTGLWTTDGHDVAFLPPGKKRTYVFVGQEFNEGALMEALTRGRCFNTCYPGAWLILTVNGAMMGDTAKPDDEGMLTVEVFCEATRPIERVELVSDGQIVHVWHGQDSIRLKAVIKLQSGMMWLLAKVFIYGRKWEKDGHSMEPIMASGCVAFTNPVWVEEYRD